MLCFTKQSCQQAVFLYIVVEFTCVVQGVSMQFGYVIDIKLFAGQRRSSEVLVYFSLRVWSLHVVEPSLFFLLLYSVTYCINLYVFLCSVSIYKSGRQLHLYEKLPLYFVWCDDSVEVVQIFRCGNLCILYFPH